MTVMDSDFSHPPQIIPKMIDALKNSIQNCCCIQVLSGGRLEDWSLKRKLSSKIGNNIVKNFLGL